MPAGELLKAGGGKARAEEERSEVEDGVEAEEERQKTRGRRERRRDNRKEGEKHRKLTPALEDLVELGLVEQLRMPRAPPFLVSCGE
jgi:hypothetical protein